MIHKTISNDRGTVHYWLDGTEGEAIIFTHGATMDHGMFQHQWGYFSQRHRVIGWDVPLHGLSRPYQDFSLKHAADDLIQILDAEDIDGAHLVGQSMGGYITQIAALEYPDRALSMTSVDSSPVQLSYYSKRDRWLLSITPFLLKLYPHNVLVNTIAAQVAIDKSAQEYAREVLKNLSTTEIATIMSAVYKGLLSYDRAVKFACPILIIYGAMDTSGKVQAYCDRWAKAEACEVQIIPDAAHNSNMDNPGVFNQVLEEFLEMTTRH
jgi:pimeloyl-ACP methyl ester carboxylesterase